MILNISADNRMSIGARIEGDASEDGANRVNVLGRSTPRLADRGRRSTGCHGLRISVQFLPASLNHISSKLFDSSIAWCDHIEPAFDLGFVLLKIAFEGRVRIDTNLDLGEAVRTMLSSVTGKECLARWLEFGGWFQQQFFNELGQPDVRKKREPVIRVGQTSSSLL